MESSIEKENCDIYFVVQEEKIEKPINRKNSQKMTSSYFEQCKCNIIDKS